MTTLVQALAANLSQHTSQAFGLMGNGNAHFIDAMTQHGIRMSTVRHEAATVASADAYTRITGKIAVATATYGAGFTNTLTALTEAAQARTPMIVVVGDEPSSGRRPWDIDQEMAAASMGVRTYTVRPEKVAKIAQKAVTKALQNRRPVVLALPYDLVNAEVPEVPGVPGVDLNDPETMRMLASATLPASRQPQATATADPPKHHPSDHEIDQAVQALTSAKRPLVLAGHGAWLAGAQDELTRIADQLGALTATTALARSIFSDQKYDLGLTGGFGQHEAMRVLTEADVVLVVGAGLNQFTMRFGELFAEGTTLVRVDLDQVSPPKSAHTIHHQLLRGDAREVLYSLISGLEHANATPSRWRDTVTGLEPGGALRVLDAGTQNPDGLCEDGRLDPRALAAKLAELLPEDRHVTSDGGHFLGWANMFWPVASPERMIMVGTAYQTIGLGFATVAGVAAAAPNSTVVVTTGDGGGLMSLADLETTVRTTRSCVVVVWNDGQYSAEVMLYGAMGLDEEPMRIPVVNFAGIADALGATGVQVHTLADLDALTAWREAGAQGTIVLDCRISGSVVAPYQREIQRVNGLKV